MLKILYKFVGLIYTAFIIFLFFINYNFLSYKDNLFLKIFYSIKINVIYYLFYIVYVVIYFKFFSKNNTSEYLKNKGI